MDFLSLFLSKTIFLNLAVCLVAQRGRQNFGAAAQERMVDCPDLGNLNAGSAEQGGWIGHFSRFAGLLK